MRHCIYLGPILGDLAKVAGQGPGVGCELVSS